jgi:hypothetical protein
MSFTARSSSVVLAARPGVAVVSFAALSGLSALPQTGTPTTISGHAPTGLLSGRESISTASGTETGLITGRQPLSSTSGTEPGTSISGRES